LVINKKKNRKKKGQKPQFPTIKRIINLEMTVKEINKGNKDRMERSDSFQHRR